MIALNAKPEQNDVVIVKTINVDFFILFEFILRQPLLKFMQN
jgi:hypothetical protein